jgi:MFS family permease
LFSLASYRNGILIATAYFGALPAIFLLTTLYLQQGLGLQAVFAGMVTIPFALVSAVSAWIGGRLVQRRGRSLVVMGLVIVIVGSTLALLAAVLSSRELTPWLMAAALGVAGLGGGFVISPNQTLTVDVLLHLELRGGRRRGTQRLPRQLPQRPAGVTVPDRGGSRSRADRHEAEGHQRLSALGWMAFRNGRSR